MLKRWWRLLKSIRILAEVEFEFSCLGQKLFKYQEIGPKVAKLVCLGMTSSDIAKQLDVNFWIVKKARRRFFQSDE